MTKVGFLTCMAVVSVFSLSTSAAQQQTGKSVRHMLFTNDGVPANTMSVFKIRGTATPPPPIALGTGGDGYGVLPSPAAKMVIVATDGTETCALVANGHSNNITAFKIPSNKFVNTFSASSHDEGINGMVSNGSYVYAAFLLGPGLATFQLNAGCRLTWITDTNAVGSDGGAVSGMALHGALLVAAYGDGSFESFTATNGILVSNGDRQPGAGRGQSLKPESVDISQNGKYAIFGDMGGKTAIEVSDISTGKLTPSVLYDNLGPGLSTANILISPNGEILYAVSVKPAQVTALRFNQKTGRVSFGCISATLNGSVTAGGLAPYSTTGTGDVLYIAEYGSEAGSTVASIGALSVIATKTQCSLAEPANSPFSDPNGYQLQSIAVYPPRPF